MKAKIAPKKSIFQNLFAKFRYIFEIFPYVLDPHVQFAWMNFALLSDDFSEARYPALFAFTAFA
jgi:hypothetical protein